MNCDQVSLSLAQALGDAPDLHRDQCTVGMPDLNGTVPERPSRQGSPPDVETTTCSCPPQAARTWRSAVPSRPKQPRRLDSNANGRRFPSGSPRRAQRASMRRRDAPIAPRTTARYRVVLHQGPSTFGRACLSSAAETRGLASPSVCLGRASRAVAASVPDEP